MKTPIQLIQEERQRQIDVEGWTLEHDDQHTDESLAMAAALYASPEELYKRETLFDEPLYFDPWPWLKDGPTVQGCINRVHAWDKRDQHDRMRRLQIAGALIVAEMERLQRAGDGS